MIGLMMEVADEGRRTPHRRGTAGGLLIRTGKRKSELRARLIPERRRLEHLGHERALVYETTLLTGLRARELRTLRVRDLSFREVPFVVLNAANEKTMHQI